MSLPPSSFLAYLEAAGGMPGTIAGRRGILRFGSPEVEVRTARSGAVLAAWSDRGILQLSGADRAKFLHGQCTQEIKGRRPGEGGYAFVLEPKGRVISDLRFVVRESGILVEASRFRSEALRKWLDRYVLISDVRITDVSDEWELMLLAGPRSREVAEASELPWPSGPEDSFVEADAAGTRVLLQSDRMTGEAGCALWVAASAAAEVHDRVLRSGRPLGLVPAGLEALDILRTEAGRPWFDVDLDEHVLPVESGQAARAVSFTKGCYTGQEVVARQHFLGRPRKEFRGLLPDAPEVQVGDAVFAGLERCGVLTTVHHSPTLGRTIALSVLRGHDHPPGTPCRIVPPGGRPESTATVASLPFVAT